MSAGGDLGNPLRKFKLVFLGEQSGESVHGEVWVIIPYCHTCVYAEGHVCNPSDLGSLRWNREGAPTGCGLVWFGLV